MRLDIKIIFITAVGLLLSAHSSAAQEVSATSVQIDPLQQPPRLGVIAPARRTQLVSRLDGVIKKILVSPNSRFKQNDILAELDCSVEKAELEEARLLHQLEKLEYKESQKKMKGDRDMHNLELETARLAMEAQLARLNYLREKLKHCRITAPYDGQVIKLFITEHNGISAGAKIMEIVDTGPLEFHFFLPVEWVDRVAPGDHIDIAYGAETYTGKIKYIALEADSIDDSFKTVARIIGQRSIPLGVTAKAYLKN